MSEPFAFLKPLESEQPYTVSEINEGISLMLESGNTIIWMEGEISNWKPSGSGHCYFKLKDSECQIPAVIWRSSLGQLKFEPHDGLAVTAIASLKVYKRGGYYQLDVHKMHPIGSGSLAAAFEKLKEKLEKDGLFDPSRKKTLPKSIRSIGVVTSKHGAAIRDIVRVVASRSPQTDIILVNVAVQGDKAPAEISAGIRDLNEQGIVDCIIVGRGGGSAEDLWAFNDEQVARAIYDSKIPVISAVGHEIDFTIADFVADLRAPTPSAAAELAVPDSEENRRWFESCASRLCGSLLKYFDGINYRYESAISRSALRKPARVLIEAGQIRDELENRYLRNMEFVFHKLTSRLFSTSSKLSSLSPLSVLSRGYSVVTGKSGDIIKRSDQLSENENIHIRFHQGSASGRILEIQK